MRAYVILLGVHLFLLWIAYDIGCDVGYERAQRGRRLRDPLGRRAAPNAPEGE